MIELPSAITVKNWPVADLAYMWLPPGSRMIVVPGKALGGLFGPRILTRSSANLPGSELFFMRFASWAEAALPKYWERATPGTYSTWIRDPYKWGKSQVEIAGGPREGQILQVNEDGRRALKTLHGPVYLVKVVKVYGTGTVRVQLLTKEGKVKKKATVRLDDWAVSRWFEPLPEESETGIREEGKYLFVYNLKWLSGFGEYPGPRAFAESIEKASVETFGIPRYRAEQTRFISSGEAGYKILETF